MSNLKLQHIKPYITAPELVQCLSLEGISKLNLEKLTFINSKSTESVGELLVCFHSQDIEQYIKNFSRKTDFVYIARKGLKFDGHNLAKKVLKSGNIFIGEMTAIESIYKSEFHSIINHELFIPVINCEKFLNIILEKAYKIKPQKFFTVAVTGTNGKTSVTQITADLLNALYNENIVKIGTLGVQIGDTNFPVSHVTTPDYPSFLGILALAEKNNINKIVMEATSHGLKEKRLGNWLADIVIFTNLTQDHLDYHQTMEDYRNAKLKLFSNHLSQQGTAIININNQEWKNFILAAEGLDKNLIIIGKSDFQNEIEEEFKLKFNSISYLTICDPVSNLQGIKGLLVLENKKKQIREQAHFSCSLIGEFQFENILCAAGVGIAQKFSLDNICQSFKSIKNIPGRLQCIRVNSKELIPTILVDYAHTPDALEKSILTCRKSLPLNGKLITVFGCGGDRDASKRPLMGDIAFAHSDFVFVTSDNPRTEEPDKIIDDIFHGINPNEKWYREPDRKKAIQKAIELATENDVILVAGKGHEDYQIIGSTRYPFSDANVVKSILEK